MQLFNPTSDRLMSLDVFRGITVALMILVNSPGNSSTYRWLKHAVWNGCTFADVVFPFFLIILGMSSVFALSHAKSKGVTNRQLIKKIMLRSLYIFTLGLLLNAFPNHFDSATIRIMGVLQRIAICYLVVSLLFLTTKMRTQCIILSVLLGGYWLILIYFPINFDELTTSVFSSVDRWFFLPQHLYSPTFEPEGLLSTLPAIASALLGNLFALCLMSFSSKKQRLHYMLCMGLILLLSGWVWGLFFPFNKSIWSSSYVLWTGGLAFLLFCFCFVLIEIKQWKLWARPFAVLGNNALLVYVLHILFLKIQTITTIHASNGQVMNLRLYLTDLFFSHFSLQNASLLYALGYTLFWLIVLFIKDACRTHYKMLPIIKKIGYSPAFKTQER